MADFTLTLFQDDDTTPLFEVGTAASHAHPYLQVPDAFGEAEVDLQQGRALIGQINVGIIDPQSGATQSDRWLTNLLANADGYTALNGRRALFAQVDPAVVVQDGVCFGVTLSDDYSSFLLQLRDIRERGRKISVFNRSGTATVLPRGVLNGYGLLPSGEWLVPPTTPLTGTYSGDTASGSIALDGAPAKAGDEVPAALVVTDKMRDAMRSVARPGSLSFIWPDEIFDRVSVLWRPVGGSTWTELKDISAPVVNLLPSLGPVFVGGLVPAETGVVKNADGSTTVVVGAKAIRVDSSAVGTLPTDGQRVEVVILYTGPASDDYPLHFEGTWGTFTRNLLRGDYCGTDDSGAVINPRIRYDEAALLAIETPVRIRATEPRDDLRSVLEELSAGIGGVPALNDAGEIRPIVYHLPDVDAELPEINDGNAEAIPGWDHPADTAITVVEVTYPRDFAVSAADDPNAERSAGDGLSSRDVTLRRAPVDLVATLGEQPLKLDFWMFRALGGTDGQPISGDAADEHAAEVAVERQHQAIDRFAYGGVSSMVRLQASAFPDLAPGDWVLDARSWRPNYQTGTRGGNALAQVVSLRRLNPAWYEARLIDAGPADQPLDQPTLGTVSAAEDGTVSVPVTAVPDGGEARVDYAISATLPATDSPLWRFLGRTATPETLKSIPLPADVTVWIRARSEGIARRRSAWTNAVTVSTAATPRILRASVTVSEAGAPTVVWAANAPALGVRLYYDVHISSVEPVLTSYVDADAAAGAATLPVTVRPGEMITVELEPYPGWSGSAASGTPGERVRRTAVRAPVDASYDVYNIRLLTDEDAVTADQGALVEEVWGATRVFTGDTPTEEMVDALRAAIAPLWDRTPGTLPITMPGEGQITGVYLQSVVMQGDAAMDTGYHLLWIYGTPAPVSVEASVIETSSTATLIATPTDPRGVVSGARVWITQDAVESGPFPMVLSAGVYSYGPLTKPAKPKLLAARGDFLRSDAGDAVAWVWPAIDSDLEATLTVSGVALEGTTATATGTYDSDTVSVWQQELIGGVWGAEAAVTMDGAGGWSFAETASEAGKRTFRVYGKNLAGEAGPMLPVEIGQYTPTSTKTPRFTDASFETVDVGSCTTSRPLKNRITVAFIDPMDGYTWEVVRFQNGDPSTAILVANGIPLTTLTQDDTMDAEYDLLGTSIDYSYRVQVRSGGVADTMWTQVQTIPVTACP